MGFMDKAKKMAEQAQSKLDEVQKNFNEKQGSGGEQQGGGVEYDEHGRPVNSAADAPPAPQPAATPTSPSPESNKVEGDPLLEESERETPSPSGSKPGMTSGDPLG
jgi:hypothetical protein